jgi:hypothetical protein
MKVCARFTVGPFDSYHARMDSIELAKQELRRQGRYDSFPDGEQPSVWVAPQCPDCWSQANFHEFATIYTLGPRGGVKKAGYYP